MKTPAVMGGEDFSRYWLADKSIESLIFWVGGTPLDKWKAAGGDAQKLPSLHSPFWAPAAASHRDWGTPPTQKIRLSIRGSAIRKRPKSSPAITGRV